MQELGDKITVTCILSHIEGHSESTTLSSIADGSGNKNSIQGIGSTVTYLERYTLTGVLGLTSADSDMDGRISMDTISEKQAEGIKERLAATDSDVKKFCQVLGITNVDAMPTGKYAEADNILTQKEAKVKKESANASA